MKKIILICLLVIVTVFPVCGCKEQKIIENGNRETAKTENTILLDGNAGTGFMWFATEYDSENLNLEDDDFIAENTQLAGSGGMFPITVTPKSEKAYGKDYILKFSYYRPFEGPEYSACLAEVPVSVATDGKVTVGEVVYTNPGGDVSCS